MTTKPLNELSDDELFDQLKAQEFEKSWTIGEIFEIERRGFEILDRDPDLRKEIETSRNKQSEIVKKSSENLRNMLLPFPNSIIDTNLLIAKMNKSLGLPQNLQGVVIDSPDWYPQTLQGITGPVSPEVSNLEINQEESERPLLDATFKQLMKEALEDYKETDKLLKRDPIFYIIALSTVVSAVATVWILVLTI